MKHTSDLTPSGTGLEQSTDVKFLGKNRSLLEATIEYITGEPLGDTSGVTNENTPAGSASAQGELYVGGMRVWNGKPRYEKGSFIYEGGIAPTQMAWPIVTYPLGPVLLQVDAGVEYEVGVEAKVSPYLSYPFEFTTIGASLKAHAAGAAYVEGYAKLLVVRGGVGGRVTVIDGAAQAAAEIYFTQAPKLSYSGKLTLLQGRVYGFVDTFNVFGWKWKRWWSPTIFDWKGKCWAFGGESCSAL